MPAHFVLTGAATQPQLVTYQPDTLDLDGLREGFIGRLHGVSHVRVTLRSISEIGPGLLLDASPSSETSSTSEESSDESTESESTERDDSSETGESGICDRAECNYIINDCPDTENCAPAYCDPEHQP